MPTPATELSVATGEGVMQRVLVTVACSGFRALLFAHAVRTELFARPLFARPRLSAAHLDRGFSKKLSLQDLFVSRWRWHSKNQLMVCLLDLHTHLAHLLHRPATLPRLQAVE
tara:strand:+ start:397 stop:735 length:339 start_codon:yes stop_codon:yes gene_type:complete